MKLIFHVRGQRSVLFTALHYWVPFHCLKVSFKSAMSITFISDLLYLFYSSYISSDGLGGDLFQNMWVVALKLAEDMLQLVLQVHNDIPSRFFSKKKVNIH